MRPQGKLRGRAFGLGRGFFGFCDEGDAMKLDQIITSTPWNKTAATVMGRGIHWEPAKKLHDGNAAWSDLPLPVSPIPEMSPIRIGDKIGRLTVMGAGRNGSGKLRYVVRCTCGEYGHQTAKFLLSPHAQIEAMCPKCRYLRELKEGNVPTREEALAMNAAHRAKKAGVSA
jgi:hypothetical protein